MCVYTHIHVCVGGLLVCLLVGGCSCVYRRGRLLYDMRCASAEVPFPPTPPCIPVQSLPFPIPPRPPFHPFSLFPALVLSCLLLPCTPPYTSKRVLTLCVCVCVCVCGYRTLKSVAVAVSAPRPSTGRYVVCVHKHIHTYVRTHT